MATNEVTNRVLVHVEVGIGSWTSCQTVSLIACPHVGDQVLVNGIVVNCERVLIGQDYVRVQETIHFSCAKDAQEYFDWPPRNVQMASRGATEGGRCGRWCETERERQLAIEKWRWADTGRR